MHKHKKRILAGLIASAALAALAVVVLRTSQPPGSFRADQRGIRGEESISDSATQPGAPLVPAHTGVDSSNPGDLGADHVLTPGSNRTDPSSPAGNGEVASVGVHIIPEIKDSAEKLRLLAQLADPSGPKHERLRAVARLGAHLANNPSDEVLKLEILRAVQIAGSSDPDEAIREHALYSLINYGDTRSFEIVVERLFDDPSKFVKERAVLGLSSVGDPGYLASLNFPKADVPPGLLGERKTAARTALKTARVNADEALAYAIDNALENLKE